MDIELGRAKRARRAYTFDDIAVVPSRRTRNPEDVSTTWTIDAFSFDIPVLGAPMDSVVSPQTSRSVSGTCTRRSIAGWQQAKISRRRSSSISCEARAAFASAISESRPASSGCRAAKWPRRRSARRANTASPGRPSGMRRSSR